MFLNSYFIAFDGTANGQKSCKGPRVIRGRSRLKAPVINFMLNIGRHLSFFRIERNTINVGGFMRLYRDFKLALVLGFDGVFCLKLDRFFSKAFFSDRAWERDKHR